MRPSNARHAPATLRNREPILDVLSRVLPTHGLVLEVASGTGEHASFFAPKLPGLRWQPTDVNPQQVASVAAWREHAAIPNLCEPLLLNAASSPWPLTRADAIVCINMIHIAPFAACRGLMKGAGSLLPPDAPLIVYGPFRLGGEHTAPSNAAFDARLRDECTEWGVRDLSEVEDAARAEGLLLQDRIAMPANNFTLVFRRSSAHP